MIDYILAGLCALLAFVMVWQVRQSRLQCTTGWIEAMDLAPMDIIYFQGFYLRVIETFVDNESCRVYFENLRTDSKGYMITNCDNRFQVLM